MSQQNISKMSTGLLNLYMISVLCGTHFVCWHQRCGWLLVEAVTIFMAECRTALYSWVLYCFPDCFLRRALLAILADILFVMLHKFAMRFKSGERVKHFIRVSPLNPIEESNSVVILSACAGALSCIKITLLSSYNWSSLTTSFFCNYSEVR